MQIDSQMLIWLSDFFIASAMKVRIIIPYILYGKLYHYEIVKWDLNEKNQSPLSNVISLGGRIKKLWIARTDWLTEIRVRECIMKVLD